MPFWRSPKCSAATWRSPCWPSLRHHG
eukprot:SM004182S15634  [mRNA]  locus=s4182:1118:1198:- [translate_table: standard]